MSVNIPSENEVVGIIQNAIDWFDDRITSLKQIADSDSGKIILAKNNDSPEIELTDEQAKGFRAGVSTAISILGKFPISLSPSSNDDPLDEDDNDDPF